MSTSLIDYKNLSDEELLKRFKNFNNLLTSEDEDGSFPFLGQRFAGGFTRGTARFWKWVFSLDFASLYPSAIMWANIGIDTLIEPKDLPKELLDLRAKYFIYYGKDVDPKDLGKFDYEFIEKVLRNNEVIEEIRSVLLKYNVCATPNGMFFKKSTRAIASQVMEDMIAERKIHKKEMKKIEQEIENLKKVGSYNQEEMDNLLAKKDKANVYQLGVKILINSYYGSLSMKASVSAGQSEYFSTAITSVGRVANVFMGQEQCRKIAEITGVDLKEVKYGFKTNLDFIAQSDTDSVYVSIEEVIKKKFGANYTETESTERLVEFTLNYINKVAMPIVRDKLDNVYAYAMNAYLPEKLLEDPEVICDCFISVAPKMYFGRKYWDEGVTLAKPKLKVTGLSMVRSSTPKYYRQELAKAMDILIEGDLPKVIEFCKGVELGTHEQNPGDICINQGVSSLNYQWQENDKRYKRWDGNKKKWLSAPVNSRAALVHNKYILEKGISVKSIEEGDKINFIYMNVPNITGSNAFAFQNESVFDHGLKDYIDRKTMFEKGFTSPIKLICDPLGWDLTPAEDQIDDSEW